MRQKICRRYLHGVKRRRNFLLLVNGQLSEPREKYLELMANPAHVEEILQAGAEKARARARIMISNLRSAVGLVNFK